MAIVVLDVLNMSGNHFAYLVVPATELLAHPREALEQALHHDLGDLRTDVRMSSWDANAMQLSVILVPKIRMQLGVCFRDRFVFLVDTYVSATYSLEDCYELVDAWPGVGERFCDGPRECLWTEIVDTLPAIPASVPIFRCLSPRYGSGVEVPASTQIHGIAEDRSVFLIYMFDLDDEEVEDESCCFLVMNPQEFQFWKVQRQVWDIDILRIHQKGRPYHNEFFAWIRALQLD